MEVGLLKSFDDLEAWRLARRVGKLITGLIKSTKQRKQNRKKS